MGWRRWLAGMLAGAMLAGAAQAASYDPRMKWRTITTEHFRIHFHQGEEALAEEYALLVEDAYDEMTEEIQWQPRHRIEVVLVDRTDYANGYASVIPYNQIVLFATAPTPDSTLASYEGWNETLFVTASLPCVAPSEAVYLDHVWVNGNLHAVFSIQDPNDSTQVTGYNVYRSDDPAPPPASWPLVASDVVDMDEAAPNKQWVDTSGDPSPSGIWYYHVTAYHSGCPAEGPF